MNSNQAKQLSLPDLLSRLGFEPVIIKRGGNELWYKSPFRNEKEPSFHISKGKYIPWVWKDFGDTGGTIIDFVMQYKGYGSIKDALLFLDYHYPHHQTSEVSPNKLQQANLFSSHQKSAKPKKNSTLELEFIKSDRITNPVIYRYLASRKIPKELAYRYLQEIRYLHKKTGKEFFAFGMPNQSGGYEIRAASDEFSFKSSLKGKDITFLEVPSVTEASAVNVFEGMLDYLSLLTMLGTSRLSADSIIMHSLSSYQSTIDKIEKEGYDKVNLFLDNNRAGKVATTQFIDSFGADKCINQSEYFMPHEDLNDALVANAVPSFIKRK